MKKSIIIFLIIFIVIAGYIIIINKDSQNSGSTDISNNTVPITDEDPTEGKGYVLSEYSDEDPQTGIQSKVILKAYYREPLSLKDSNTIVLNGLMQGEFIEFIVEGEISNFEHVELIWDDAKNVLKEKRIIHKFDKITNQTILLLTYMPEGIPSEKIKWTNASGKTNEFIIAASMSDD